MERLNFSSFMRIFLEHIRNDCYRNRKLLIDDLFHECNDSSGAEDLTYDKSLVNKWLNGTANISPTIISYYHAAPSRLEGLAFTLQDVVFPTMSDVGMAVQRLYDLLIQDDSISDSKKNELCDSYPCQSQQDEALFLARLLCFSMGRKPVQAKQIHQLVPIGTRSPVIRDFIAENYVPSPCEHFCGREQELTQFHNLMQEHSKVFVYGIPGIGKSEFVKAYAETFKKEYTNIIYMMYSGGLKHDIANLCFADDRSTDDENMLFHKHNRFLRTLKKDTLLIVDNLDASFADDEILSVLMNYQCSLLFTTRRYFRSQKTFHLQEIANKAELFHLMQQLYGEADDHRSVIEQIIDVVHGHTMLVAIVGNLLEFGLCDPEHVLRQLQIQKAAFNSTEQVELKKDGKQQRNTYYAYLRTLVSLFELEQEEQELLQALSLMPVFGIHDKLFAAWMREPDMNTIHCLVESGLVQRQDRHILMLHPMIQEVIYADLQPAVSNSGVLLSSLNSLCLIHGIELPYQKIVFQVIESIMQNIIQDDIPAYLLFIEDAFPNMEKYRYQSGMALILDEMKRILKDKEQGSVRDRALLLNYSSVCADSDAAAAKLNEKAIALYQKVDKSESASILMNLYCSLCSNYLSLNNLKKAKEAIEQAFYWMNTCTSTAFHDRIAICNAYITVLARCKNMQKAKELAEGLADFIRINNCEECDDYATALVNIADICLCMRDYVSAEQHARRAFEIFQKIYANEPELLAENCRFIIELFEKTDHPLSLMLA